MTPPSTFTPNWHWLMRHKTAFIGFGFGSGLSPHAPGTVGSVVGVMLSGLLLGSGLSHVALAVMGLLSFSVGIWICDQTEQAMGGIHDHKGIVWDEIVAMMLVYACVPQGFFWWILAFALFRLFDIVKPQPVKWADERLTGGLGVMSDDALAAGYTIVIVQLIHAIFF